MSSTIGFEHLKVVCIIGTLPQERVQEQVIYFDLHAKLKKPLNDAIENTVSYVDLANLCTQIAVKGQFNLIETLASAVLHELAKNEKIALATVRIKKPGALADATHAFCELEETFRDK